jgi:hypothetical protein
LIKNPWNTKLMNLNRKYFTKLIPVSTVFVGIVIAFYLVNNSRLNSQPLLDVSPTTVPQATPSPSPIADITIYEDKALSGFSFKYDANKWNTVVADSKDCTGAKCDLPYGRIVSITNKNYPQGPSAYSLAISIIDAKRFSGVETSPICFNEGDLRKINDDWISARNPFEGAAHQDMQKNWPRYIYQTATVKEIDDKTCINGTLSIPQQQVLPVKYKGKPTILQIELTNSVSVKAEQLIDEIITSIKFK